MWERSPFILDSYTKLHPKSLIMDHSSEVTYSGEGLSFEAQIDTHTFHISSGEPETGPSPKKLMLTALAGCTAIDVVSILNKMRVLFSDFTVKAEADLTESYPAIYQNVLISYSIRIQPKDRPQMEKAVKLSLEKYCGVSAMFARFSTINHKIEYLDT